MGRLENNHGNGTFARKGCNCLEQANEGGYRDIFRIQNLGPMPRILHIEVSQGSESPTRAL